VLKPLQLLSVVVLLTLFCLPALAAGQLKVHGIFRSNMVLQRDKPIMIWGWAPQDAAIKVTFGDKSAMTKADGKDGRWQVTFDPQPANANPQTLTVTAGEQKSVMDNILVGDIWVMNGQSNMAFSLKAVYDADFEASMAHQPLLRHFRIDSGAESEHVEIDLNEEHINGGIEDHNWRVCTPEVALDMGAIGFAFGSRIQRALDIPIGIIDNARGGASMESLVPRSQFARDPELAEYLAWVDARNAAFDEKAFLDAQMLKYEQQLANYNKQIEQDKQKGVDAKRKKPQMPDGSIRTWSVPGRSPSDAASCYNGMFGVFKGLNIKGVAFHQGFNNAMMNTSCNPRFYRKLMRYMVEGWREDFNDPNLPVAVIGLCAGGTAQTRLNFEVEGLSTASFIRESQRLGLQDAGDSEHTAFIPSYDQKIPQLHTKKKVELGFRTARWALKSIYGFEKIDWAVAELESVQPQGGAVLLTFDRPVRVDDFGSEIEGFSVAGKDGIYYMASAVYLEPADKNDKSMQFRQILVSSPLVDEPTGVRYAWARSPMGNLKVDGLPWQPLHSFRTDTAVFEPEVSHLDPEGPAKNSAVYKVLKQQAVDSLELRLGATAGK